VCDNGNSGRWRAFGRRAEEKQHFNCSAPWRHRLLFFWIPANCRLRLKCLAITILKESQKPHLRVRCLIWCSTDLSWRCTRVDNNSTKRRRCRSSALQSSLLSTEQNKRQHWRLWKNTEKTSRARLCTIVFWLFCYSPMWQNWHNSLWLIEATSCCCILAHVLERKTVCSTKYSILFLSHLMNVSSLCFEVWSESEIVYHISSCSSCLCYASHGRCCWHTERLRESFKKT